MWPRLKRSVLFWFAIGALLGAAITAPFAVIEKRLRDRLMTAGEATDAAVVDRRQSGDSDGKSYRWLKLQYYDLGQKEWVTEQSVDSALWEKYPVGSLIKIRYLRENPKEAKLEEKIEEWRDLAILAAVFGGVGVALIIWAAAGARRA